MLKKQQMRCVALGVALCVAAGGARAQAVVAGSRPERGEGEARRKQATAVRVRAAAVSVDGRLDEAAWAAAPVVADFTQKQPDEGAPASERTEVRFLYDEDALYVGARLYSADAASIQAPVGRRDSDVYQMELFLVSLDTYLDRRTAYTFGVTASGVRSDWYHPTDD